MWELARAAINNPKGIEFYLKAGFEPFAVTNDAYQGEVVWLKKVKKVKGVEV